MVPMRGTELVVEEVELPMDRLPIAVEAVVPKLVERVRRMDPLPPFDSPVALLVADAAGEHPKLVLQTDWHSVAAAAAAAAEARPEQALQMDWLPQ